MSQKTVDKVYSVLYDVCNQEGFDFDNWSTLKLSAKNFLEQSKDYHEGVFYKFWKTNFLELSSNCLFCNGYNFGYDTTKNHREAEKLANKMVREFNKQTKNV